MDIGIPREHRTDEYRVGLTPAGVGLLTAMGHSCYVEKSAGLGAGFSDLDYEREGGKIVYSPLELYARSMLLLKFARPTAEEIDMLNEGSIVLGFLHLVVSRRERIETLLRKNVTAIAYDLIQADNGTLPVQVPLSQAAGRLTPAIAATLMQNNHGGKGILLRGVPGVPPAEVVILGAGAFGTAAANAFLRTGASVYVLDRDLAKLQALDEGQGMYGRLVTMVSHPFNIRKATRFADVLVGGILVPGERTPMLVTREMVKRMKPRSVIIDASIDQGGCIETSRLTTHRDPTYIEENVIHYCVPNMTSVVARTATHAFNNAAWPFIHEIALHGLEHALSVLPPLKRGVMVHNGRVVNSTLAEYMGVKEVAL
jgi:alanine dehydrogenase